MPSPRSTKSWVTAATALVCFPGVAMAHTGHTETAGFVSGVFHPLVGVDHVLAMTSVGALGALMGGRALWAAPALFVAMMGLGGLAGASHLSAPIVESGLVVSVLVLGVMLVPRLRPRSAIVFGLIALFGLLHGFAHGAEIPANANGLEYATGFLCATALLHAAGIAVALALQRIFAARAVPARG